MESGVSGLRAKVPSMGAYTHVLEYDGGELVTEMPRRVEPYEFANPLHRFNGESQWALMLASLPAGKSYADVLKAGDGWTNYLQAAGSGPDAITVEIRKPGGKQWGAKWVRYVVGHPHDGDAPIDVAIELPESTQMLARYEVFDADEAARLFSTYHQTGDIPAQYTLRPVEGYTTDGTIIDLRDGFPRRVE